MLFSLCSALFDTPKSHCIASLFPFVRSFFYRRTGGFRQTPLAPTRPLTFSLYKHTSIQHNFLFVVFIPTRTPTQSSTPPHLTNTNTLLPPIHFVGRQRRQQDLHVHGLDNGQTGSLEGRVEETLPATNPRHDAGVQFLVEGAAFRIGQDALGVHQHDLALLQNLLDDRSGGTQKGRSGSGEFLADEALTQCNATQCKAT